VVVFATFMRILTDYHVHTPLCKHAAGPMEACVERAIELGLAEIGFACHNPLPHGLGTNERMAESELDYYVQRVIGLQFQYRGRIEVLLGLEMDFLPGHLDYLHAQANRYPWDYLIGAVHYLDDDCTLFVWSRNLPMDAEEQYTRYYRLVGELARSGLVDFVAHLDVPKRSGRYPGARGLAELQCALDAIREADLAMEVNTSGYRHPELPEPQPYPALPVLGEASRRGIKFVVNSDAHRPEQVGSHFAGVAGWLGQHGCRELARFARRQRRMVAA